MLVLLNTARLMSNINASKICQSLHAQLKLHTTDVFYRGGLIGSLAATDMTRAQLRQNMLPRHKIKQKVTSCINFPRLSV